MFYDTEKKPVIIVGHSLGGVLARYLGTEFPDEVRGVALLGSPLHQSFVSTFLSWQAKMLFSILTPCVRARESCACGLVQAVSRRSSADRGRLVSIYSRNDQVVHWKSSMADGIRSYEVGGGHLALVVNQNAYRAMANAFVSFP